MLDYEIVVKGTVRYKYRRLGFTLPANPVGVGGCWNDVNDGKLSLTFKRIISKFSVEPCICLSSQQSRVSRLFAQRNIS